MEKFKRWLTYRLVKLASQLDGEMFIHLCGVAMLAQHRQAIVALEEVIRGTGRLEQEHDYYYNHENEEQDYDTVH
jgi:hypothetical protein